MFYCFGKAAPEKPPFWGHKFSAVSFFCPCLWLGACTCPSQHCSDERGKEGQRRANHSSLAHLGDVQPEPGSGLPLSLPFFGPLRRLGRLRPGGGVGQGVHHRRRMGDPRDRDGAAGHCVGLWGWSLWRASGIPPSPWNVTRTTRGETRCGPHETSVRIPHPPLEHLAQATIEGKAG